MADNMQLPSDPEGMNDNRAEWAQVALDAFRAEMRMQGEDDETVFGDLLCDMAHWCDRNGVSLQKMLLRAESNYAEETGNDGTQCFLAY